MRHGGRADAAQGLGKGDPGIGDLRGTGLALKLAHELDHLVDAAGAERIAARLEAA